MVTSFWYLNGKILYCNKLHKDYVIENPNLFGLLKFEIQSYIKSKKDEEINKLAMHNGGIRVELVNEQNITRAFITHYNNLANVKNMLLDNSTLFKRQCESLSVNSKKGRSVIK